MNSSSSSSVASAERRLFASLGVTPVEHGVALERLGCRVRVLELGEGPPVLFMHGVMTAGPSWASLASALTDFRCLLLDRPGCGLSEMPEPWPGSLAAQEQVAASLVVDVLDALELDRAHIVSTSLGSWYAFRGAARHRERIARIVGLGFPVGARIAEAPLFMRVQAPGWLAGRMPVSKRLVRAMLRSAGMRRAIDSGGFGDELLDWMVALLNNTDTMRNELLAAPRPIGPRGPIDAVRLPTGLARHLASPIQLVWGTDDPFGGENCAAEFASMFPNASVDMVPHAGHAPWLDEPELVSHAVRSHLSAE